MTGVFNREVQQKKQYELVGSLKQFFPFIEICEIQNNELYLENLVIMGSQSTHLLICKGWHMAYLPLSDLNDILKMSTSFCIFLMDYRKLFPSLGNIFCQTLIVKFFSFIQDDRMYHFLPRLHRTQLWLRSLSNCASVYLLGPV